MSRNSIEKKVYLDYNATTPVDPDVLETMLPFFKEHYGNPSSLHQWGRKAREAVEQARVIVADALNARESEIYFVSGGTEADNLVIQGVMFQNRQKGNHLITTRVEHPAVLNTCKFLEKQGFSVTYLKVDQYGQVDPQAVKDSIRKETVLVSIIHANNEVGTINDLESIASITQEAGVWLHSDAVQSFGKIPLDVQKIPVDFLSLSGHKIYGPKGIGVVYARRGTIFRPLLFGGSHEHSRRAGTENVPAIVGLGKATQLMVQNRKQIQEHVESLRNYFEEHLKNKYPEIRINGHPTQRLFTTSNVAFPRVDQETLLLQLDMHGIAVSSGSACSSGSIEPSHVLQAMGIPAPIATRSLRFSFGKFTTRDEVDYVLSVLDKILTPKRNR